MSTHYEVLGVAPTAGPDDVRAAYLAIAKANHPDRRSAQDPARREAAELAMKRANQAWFVLRDPGRRAEYDRTLADRTPGASPGRVGSPSGGPRRSGDIGGERVASGVVVPASQVGLYRWLPVVVAVVVLGGILVFSAYATSQNTSAPSGPTTTAPTFPVGTCVLVAALDTGPQPVKVACGTGNSARVDSIVATPRPCPPDSAPLPLDDNRTTLCLKSAR